MTTETLTLTAFLLARIDEDEAAARAVPELEHNFDMGGNRQDERFTFGRTLPSSADGMGNWSQHRDSPTTRDHFARHDPARVLATCKAHRAIVTKHPDNDGSCGTCTDRDYLGLIDNFPCDTLRALASIYADHADFREEWAL